MGKDREGAIARWSRLKRSNQGAPPAQRSGAAPPANPEAAASLTRAPKDSDGTPSADANAAAPPSTQDLEDLPTIESLAADSDYTPFLKEGVPWALARAALRKLWLSDPVLANLDGLNDYDEDYGVIQPITSALNMESLTEKGAPEDPKVKAAEKTPMVDATPESEAEDGAIPPEEGGTPEAREDEPPSDDKESGTNTSAGPEVKNPDGSVNLTPGRE